MSASMERAQLAGDLKRVGHRVLSGALGGSVWGLLIGGLGGRLAMLLLRLTTGDGVVGVESDDEFTMGTLSSATGFLLAATSFLGAFVGGIYSFIGGWLPERRRAVWTAALLGLAGGAAVIHPGGVDFTRLSPLPLAIALFVLLPALFGYAMSGTVDRLLTKPAGRILPWVGLAGAVFVVGAAGLDGPAGIPILIGLVVLVALALIGVQRYPQLRSLPEAPAMMWTARIVLLLGGVFSAFLLVRDVVEIL